MQALIEILVPAVPAILFVLFGWVSIERTEGQADVTRAHLVTRPLDASEYRMKNSIPPIEISGYDTVDLRGRRDG